MIVKVLILDDSRMTRQGLKRLYSSFLEDVEYVETESAEEAEELLADHTFELASIDLNLPGKDGFEFSQILAEKFPDTRKVIITGNQQDLVKEKAHKLGVMVINKPSSELEMTMFRTHMSKFLGIRQD